MEKVNIANLLRDCPKGMELDCTMYDNCTYEGIEDIGYIDILINTPSGRIRLTKEGCYIRHDDNAKCVIFPKGKTTWEGFHRPFVEGDVIYADSFIAILSNITESGRVWYHCYYCNNTKAFKAQRDFGLGNINDGEFRFATEEEKQKLFDAIRENGYHWDAESKILKRWTIQDAKDGDIVSYRNGWTCIFKCIHGICYSSYCFITIDGEFHTGYEKHEVSTTINGNVHLATKEQYDRLFQKMKEAGYEWNPETKTLVKLPKFKVGYKIKQIKTGNIHEIIKIIPNYYITRYLGSDIMISFNDQDEYEIESNKFDFSKLKPFDKVLVRDFDNETWEIDFFSRLLDGKHFKCLDLTYVQCIPYEDNEHLYNTTNKCDEFFKIWKDE